MLESKANYVRGWRVNREAKEKLVLANMMLEKVSKELRAKDKEILQPEAHEQLLAT